VVWAEQLDRPTDASDDTDGAIFARIFDEDGKPTGDAFQVNGWQPFEQDLPQVVALDTGGFAIGWTSTGDYGDSPKDPDTFIKTYDANGSPTGLKQTIDLVRDNPGDPNDSQILSELVPLSQGRVGVLLDNGTMHVVNPGSNNAERVSWEPLGDGLSGMMDAAQLEDRTIVQAVSTGGNAILVRLTDAYFGGPNGIPGIYRPLDFAVVNDPARVKGDVEVAALADGGFALAYSQAGSSSGGANVTIEVDILTDYGELEFRNTVLWKGFGYDPESSDFDMIGLSNGMLALAAVGTDEDGVKTGVDLLLLDADGTKVNRVQATLNDVGNQFAPSLTETADGNVALAFSDTSGKAIGGTADPLHLAIFNIGGKGGSFDGTGRDDVLRGLGGNDTLKGLAGNDILDGGKNDDTLIGGGGRDKLYGGTGADHLLGNNGADLLKGQAGNDGLNGGGGNDRLSGGNGNDMLRGGKGADVLIGGDGNDIFVFAGAMGDDTVRDFEAGTDTLRFRGGNGEVTSYSGFLRHAEDTRDGVLYDRGDDGANTILLEDVSLSDLSRSDFDFL
jgi:Ca2+-binding RTX toxin-like protein